MKPKKYSLGKQMQVSHIIISTIMIIPMIYAIAVSIYHTKQYDNIITNVSRANKINLIAKNDIPTELWNVVSGAKTFGYGQQYLMLQEIELGIREMRKTTAGKVNKQKLNVVERTEETLLKNITKLGDQISAGATVEENVVTLDEIRGIILLFSEVMQDFIISEIESAAETNESIRVSSIILISSLILFLILVIVLSISSYFKLSSLIKKPILDMQILSTKIAHGDLKARIVPPGVGELDGLAENLNMMASKIDILIKQLVEEQANLQKAELKALQAQITPHFLYNTFDTIIWLAEGNKTEDVIKITRAFSEFLRITLSRGHEWITVDQEIDHVKNYLTIQKVRYRDILDYEIDIEPEITGFRMLKLILQPLVENAIYHGIKNKRGRGFLKVRAFFSDADKKNITFAVEDNGAGFTPERLEEVRREIGSSEKKAENLSSVYGLFNVNKRLILYYNGGTDGLHIESEKGKGCRIWFTVGCQSFEQKE